MARNRRCVTVKEQNEIEWDRNTNFLVRSFVQMNGAENHDEK